MAKQDFIPAQDNAFQAWHDTFLAALKASQQTLDLTADQIGAIAADNAALHADMAALDAADQARQAATKKKNATKSAAERRARELTRGIKSNPQYTESIGEELGIIGPEDTTDLSGARPTLTLDDRQPRRVVIGFNKSVSDGVNLYSKRPGEAAFTFLARDTESPYVDTRPCLGNTPEQRQYYALYVLHDEEVGLQSDVAQGVCQP